MAKRSFIDVCDEKLDEFWRNLDHTKRIRIFEREQMIQSLNPDLIRLISEESDPESKVNLALVNRLFYNSIRLETFNELMNHRIDRAFEYVKHWLQFENTVVQKFEQTNFHINLILRTNDYPIRIDPTFGLNCINGLIGNGIVVGSLYWENCNDLITIDGSRIRWNKLTSKQKSELNQIDKLHQYFHHRLSMNECAEYDKRFMNHLLTLKESDPSLSDRIQIL